MNRHSLSSLTSTAAENIRLTLTRRRMSGRELCRRLDVSHTWLSKRLAGDPSMTLADIEAIAAELQVPVGDLLGLQPTLSHPVAQEIDEVLTDGSTSRRTRDRLLEVLGTIMRMYYEKTDQPAITREPKMRESKPSERPRRGRR
jgi:transcriptional regulator with XRE-family HTH domain